MIRHLPAVRRAALLLALAACVDGPGGPGRFGEVRVEPAYRAGYEPGAIGVALDTASVMVARRSGELLLDGKVPYTGGPLAWVVDLVADEESLDVTVELWSGGARRYAGDTAVLVESGVVASGQTHAVSVAWVGPPVVSAVTVTPSTDTLNAPGATRQFAAVARDPDGAVVPGATFTWTSSDGAVATVDATGTATAVGDGTTTITATNGSVAGSATLAVRLPPPVVSVTVSPATVTLGSLGATQQYTAVARDAGGNVVPGVMFTWASTNGAVATIDAATGLATAAGDGSTTITATTGSVSGSATLNVNLAATVATVDVTPATTTLTTLGATQQYLAEGRDVSGNVVPGVTFTWASTNGAVATIDAATGLATATGDGATTITATTGSVSGSATLNVNLAATVATVDVTPATATLTALGATQQYTAVARDGNGNVVPGVTFTWASTNGAVASIDAATGLATATGDGSATITATTGSVSGAAALNVNLAATVATVDVTPATATLTALGATQQYTAVARDAGGNVVPGVTFTWASTNGAVATIDAATGLATATGDGSTTITATAGSVSGAATLNVSLVGTVVTVDVTPATATLTALGATQQYTAVARDAGGNVVPGVTFTWASTNGAVATVDAATGLATATGDGSATITATTGSVSGAAALNVNLAATVATVDVTPATATLTALGATQQYTAVARDAGGNVVPGVTFTWASTNGAVATIHAATGLATATGDGATTITATTGSVSGAAALNVNLAATVATVDVTPATATLTALGATQQYTAVARDGNGNVVPGVTFTWASTNGAVASIDAATGLATATGDGSTTIRATTGSVTGSATLNVNLAATVATVDVTPATVTLMTLGATQQYTAVARDVSGNVVPGVVFTWGSSDGAVATIDVATGLATATGHGATTIAATTAGVSGTAQLDVDLTRTVITVTVTPAMVTLIGVGTTQQFTAVALDANGNVVPGVTFTWSSSATVVATIDAPTGLATAVGYGSTTISAMVGAVAGTALLTVNERPQP